MKCPYNININQVHQDRYEYDEENANTTLHEQKLVEKRSFTECFQAECGAWHDGRCCYKEFT